MHNGKRFKEKQFVTYKCFGGSSYKILEYCYYNDHMGCWEVKVESCYGDNSHYKMLECEFVEYDESSDGKKKNGILEFKKLKKKKIKLNFNTN